MNRSSFLDGHVSAESLVASASPLVSDGVTRERLQALLSDMGILIPDPDGVISYLERHQESLSPLLSLCKQAVECFAEDSQVSLELYNDREIDESYLTLYVRQAVYSSDLIDRIEQLADSFDGQELGTAWPLLTTDFVPPRVQDAV
ncbi:MAG: hypothetical protein ACR2PL_12310 [Dehalococcoidia bacterium]